MYLNSNKAGLFSRSTPAIVLLLISQAIPAQNSNRIDGPASEWLSHIQYLASDELAGRETGSEGHRKAAEYVAAAFKRAGLKPGGSSGSYFQQVQFVSRRIVEERSKLSLVRNGKEEPIVFGDDAVISSRVPRGAPVDAPIVFVGYGLSVPEMKYDDLAGLDLRGKVAMLLPGGPSEIPGPLRAHYGSTRWESLRRAGAVGVISIQNPIGQDIPWDRSKLSRFRPSLSLAGPGFNENSGNRLAATINPAKAERFFAGSGHTFSEILKLVEAGKALPRFPIPARVRASIAVEEKPVESRNVIGLLPGSDPKLKNEYVVMSAHLDHVGVGEPINNDKIYNGAMDNASGIATLLEAARTFSEKKQTFRRSVIFLAVTAEEHGLLGSRYFATRPTVPLNRIVANINIDMFLPLFPLRSVIVQGLEESDLASDMRTVGKRMGIEVLSDPEPERRAFVRSDQYSFIRRGVPALSLKVGFAKNSPEHEIVKRWRRDRYHAPSDDLQQPIDLEAAARFNEAYMLVVEAVADRTSRPRWNADSFFKRFARA
jgi:hypothetical protein